MLDRRAHAESTSAGDSLPHGETREARARWLLLIHHIPPKPDYFRVKVRRRLQRLGAVALKPSVYVLPNRPESVEDFQWLRREIDAEGGEAILCEATLVEGLSDSAIEELFNRERNAEYQEIVTAASELTRGVSANRSSAGGERGESPDVSRLERRLSEVAAIDFFTAPSAKTAREALEALRARAHTRARAESRSGTPFPRGATWVTRRGVFVDRIASAWLIRRFIDPEARFAFVSPEGYVPAPGELRFDMFEAEYTHEGDRCTFETLLRRFDLADDPALAAIAEIVHDIDLKDDKYARTETAGVERLLAGIAAAHRDDAARLARGALAFDDLYAAFLDTPRQRAADDGA